jgi:uncharacterized protein (DUF885 family)
MREFRRALICGTLFLLPLRSYCQGTVHERLVSLAEEVTYKSAELYPLQATALGITGHDAELENPSEAYRAGFVDRLKKWQQRLREITTTFSPTTSLVDRDDATLLNAQLEAELNSLLVYQVDRKDYSAPANNVVQTIFTQFQHLPVVGRDGASQSALHSAWSDIISRLSKSPAYIKAAQRLVTTPGNLYDTVGSKELGGVPEFLNGALTDAAKAQIHGDAAAFARFVKARNAALAEIAATKAYIDTHVSSWPENYAIGREAYDRMLHDEQLLPFNAADIERMGNDELAHGWAEEAWLTAMSQHTSTPFGAQSGGGMAPGGAALIDYYRDRIAELRKFVTDNDVVTIPVWLGAMQVTETPSFLQPVSPGASMNPPLLFSTSTTGYYYITPPTSLADAAARLDMNEDFDRDRIISTAAHEALPGHFMQLSIAKRHPDFIRKIQFTSVFAEGWAFYGEEMFVRLGLYGDHLDGRLFTARWERVRGARAIIDAKLATQEWTYPQAVDFFAAQTAFTHDAAEAAVAALALGPGYGLTYTVGRLQIENLLSDYLLKMQGKGSLRDFHDRLLSYGTTPLAIVAPELLADLDKPASEVRAAANY